MADTKNGPESHPATVELARGANYGPDAFIREKKLGPDPLNIDARAFRERGGVKESDARGETARSRRSKPPDGPPTTAPRASPKKASCIPRTILVPYGGAVRYFGLYSGERMTNTPASV